MMFFKRRKIEVVPASEYTDYSERFKEFEKMREEDRAYASKKHVYIAASASAAAGIAFVGYNNSKRALNTLTTTSQVVNSAPVVEPSVVAEPIHALAQPVDYTMIPVTADPGGGISGATADIVSDFSFELFTKIADPVIQLLTALSFPIASVIVVGALFMMMFGMKEKALTMAMNAGIGYVLIQFSPLLLDMLRMLNKGMMGQ